MTRQHRSMVTSNRGVAEGIFVISFTSREIAREILPGQFLNIRVVEGTDPLLRRPFSIYRTDGDTCEVIYQVVGKGTGILSGRKPGEILDILAPLGTSFGLDDPSCETPILIGGGLGVAPLPIATAHLRARGRTPRTFLGGRTSALVIRDYLTRPAIATDDGSEGFHGTVVDLLRSTLENERIRGPKIFGCGPTPMLRALKAFAAASGIPCELSLEGPMACGIGICQGCPVELEGEEKRYALMCKDGPVFDAATIKL